MNIRQCDSCDYEAMTSIEEDYQHRRCDGIMRLIAIEVANEYP